MRPRFHQSPAGLQELLRQDPQAKSPQLGGAAHPSTPRSRGGAQAFRKGRNPPHNRLARGLDQITNGVCSILGSCERGGRACLHAACWVTGCNLLQVCSQRPFLPPAFGTEAANTGFLQASVVVPAPRQVPGRQERRRRGDLHLALRKRGNSHPRSGSHSKIPPVLLRIC